MIETIRTHSKFSKAHTICFHLRKFLVQHKLANQTEGNCYKNETIKISMKTQDLCFT